MRKTIGIICLSFLIILGICILIELTKNAAGQAVLVYLLSISCIIGALWGLNG